jgi:hypothetical protein
MRPLIVVGVIATAASIGICTSAQAQNYPWCAHYGEDDGGTNCGFTSFQQCLADISGMGGFCEQNNTYVPPIAPAPHQALKHHRHKKS